jgi:hypothetical protein
VFSLPHEARYRAPYALNLPTNKRASAADHPRAPPTIRERRRPSASAANRARAPPTVRERRQPCASAANRARAPPTVRERRQPTRAPPTNASAANQRARRRRGKKVARGEREARCPWDPPQKEIRIEDPTDDVLNSAKRAAPRLTHSTCRRPCASAAIQRERRQPCASAANQRARRRRGEKVARGEREARCPWEPPKKRDQDRRSDRRRAELREAR